MKAIRLIFGLIVIVLLAVFLISNRGGVAVNYWPFGAIGSAALGAIVLIAFGAGVALGLVLTVPQRIGALRRARRAEKRAADLERRQTVTSPTTSTTPALSHQK